MVNMPNSFMKFYNCEKTKDIIIGIETKKRSKIKNFILKIIKSFS